MIARNGKNHQGNIRISRIYRLTREGKCSHQKNGKALSNLQINNGINSEPINIAIKYVKRV